jgi:hypothetical protein
LALQDSIHYQVRPYLDHVTGTSYITLWQREKIDMAVTAEQFGVRQITVGIPLSKI